MISKFEELCNQYQFKQAIYFLILKKAKHLATDQYLWNPCYLKHKLFCVWPYITFVSLPLMTLGGLED